MTDTDNLILAQIRDIRSVLDTIICKLDEITSRIEHLEQLLEAQP
jgi:hypothetical protein